MLKTRIITMRASSAISEIAAGYQPVDIKSEPNFSQARITGVVLSAQDEINMRKDVGQVIEAGNNLSGYSRKELALLCDIKSAQFSKIIKGEAWLNMANLGMWGFATGINPSDVAKLTPLHATPSNCITWFMNGRLHHLDHDEFELFTKLICRRMGVRHVRVNVAGDEPLPKLKDKNWQSMYADDLGATVARRIRQLRDCLGLSQKGLGDILGVTPETVKRYESGKVRVNRGIFSTFRFFATTNVPPIEFAKGSIHHKLRYVQEQRQKALHEITKQLDYKNYKILRDITLSISKA